MSQLAPQMQAGLSVAAVQSRWLVWSQLDQMGYSNNAIARAVGTANHNISYARKQKWKVTLRYKKQHRLDVDLSIVAKLVESCEDKGIQKRWTVWRLLHNKYHYSLKAIARLSGVHPTSLTYAKKHGWVSNSKVNRRNQTKINGRSVK